jgi:hypothetical protein
MRLRDQVIGALNLFRAEPGAFDPGAVDIGQALADVATISLLHERSMQQSDILNEQLQTALNSRVMIEQAKGILAERLGLGMTQAFNVMRDFARNHNLRLADVAQSIIDGTAPIPSQTAATAAPLQAAGEPGKGRWACTGRPWCMAQAVDRQQPACVSAH